MKELSPIRVRVFPWLGWGGGILAVLIAAGLIAQDRQGRAAFLEQVRERNQVRMQAARNQIETYMDDIWLVLRLVSMHHHVIEIKRDSVEYLQSLYEASYERHHLDEIYVLRRDFDGKRKPYMTFEKGDELREAEELHTLEREAAEYAVQCTQIGEFVEKPSLNCLISEPVQLCTGRPGVVCSVPIRDGTELVGIVAGMVSLDNISEVLENSSPGNMLILANERGSFVCCSDFPSELRTWYQARLAGAMARDFFARRSDMFQAGRYTGHWTPANLPDEQQWYLGQMYEESAQLEMSGISGPWAGWGGAGIMLLLGGTVFFLCRLTPALIIARHEADTHARGLVESEARTRAIVDTAADGIITIDETGKIESFNASAERMFGYAAKEVVGRDADMLVSSPHRAQHVEFVRRFLRDGETTFLGTRHEVEAMREGGATFPLEVALSEVSVSGRRLFTCIARDLTELRRSEELSRLLEESRRRRAETEALLQAARAILEHSEFEPAARSIFDACRSLIGATAGYVALLNKEGDANEQQFLDSGGSSRAVDKTQPMPIRGFRAEIYRTGKAAFHNDFDDSDWQSLLPEGHVALQNVLFAPLEAQGKIVGLLELGNKPGGFTDNDARMATAFGELASVALQNSRALELLEANEQRFRSVMETAGDAIVSIDDQGVTVFWNRAAESMFGHSADEMCGQPLTLIMPARFRRPHQQGLQRLLTTGETNVVGHTVRLVGLRRDGAEFPMELSVARWETSQGAFFTGIVRDITEREQAEAAVRAERDKSQRYLDIAGVMIVVINADQSTALVNKKCCAVLGYDEQEIVGQNWFDRFLPEREQDTVRRAFDNLIAGEIKPVEYFENRVLTNAGEERIIAWHNAALRDEQGAIVGTLSSGEDITERKRAEAELQKRTHELGERNKELNCLYGISRLVEKPAATFEEIVQGTLDLIPPAWRYPALTCARFTLHGYVYRTRPFEEGPWKQIAPVIMRDRQVGVLEVHYRGEHAEADEDPFLREERHLIDAIAERLGRIIEHRQAEDELQAVQEELELRVAQRTAELTESNSHLQGEIAERQRAEGELREAERRYRTLFEQLPDAVVIIDPDVGMPIEFNDLAPRLLGYTRAEFSRLRVSDYEALETREEIQAHMQKVLRAGQDEFETKMRTKAGELIDVRVSIQVVELSGRKIFHNILHDITARVRAEELARQRQTELAHVARLGTIGEMAAGLAHELNQPLTAIVNYVQASLVSLYAGRGKTDELIDDMTQAAAQAERAGEIIERVRDFVRKDKPRRERVDFNDLVREAVDLIKFELRQAEVAVRLDLQDGLPAVSVEPIQIEQVLVNIMRNSLEAMADNEPETREMTIRTSRIENGGIEVVILDRGSGLNPEIAEQVFDPFFTTKREGMGMGLSICRSIVEAHGGRLWAQPRSEGGAMFGFTLGANDGEGTHGA